MWGVIHWYRPQFTICICQSCRTAYQHWEWKSLTPCGSFWSWCSLLRGTEKIQSYLRQWKGRERERCWYTKTICVENQPWQHHSLSVEWRYPGSCVTLLFFITAHTFLLNPITADQCCLFHSLREMSCLKVIFSWQFLGPKLAQLAHHCEIFHWAWSMTYNDY